MTPSKQNTKLRQDILSQTTGALEALMDIKKSSCASSLSTCPLKSTAIKEKDQITSSVKASSAPPVSMLSTTHGESNNAQMMIHIPGTSITATKTFLPIAPLVGPLSSGCSFVAASDASITPSIASSQLIPNKKLSSVLNHPTSVPGYCSGGTVHGCSLLLPRQQPIQQLSTHGYRNGNLMVLSEGKRDDDDCKSGENVSAVVRTDEIERALKSAPQRGKKRENLNQDERKELTKSRNRLHAKSTRLRKKARYDELLDVEKSYTKMMETKVLHDSRRSVVLKLHLLWTECMNSNFVERENNHELISASLQELFVSSAVVTVSSVNGNRQNLTIGAFRTFLSNFAGSIRHDDEKFKVMSGSADSVALSNIGTAFSQYHIVSYCSENSQRDVSSGFMQVHFVEQSSQIASVTMYFTTEEPMTVSTLCGVQEMVPSVISVEKFDVECKRHE